MFGFSSTPTISAQELEAKLGTADAPFLVDVREPHEFEGGHIPGALLMPLGSLPQRAGELPKDRPLAMICRSGARSDHATSHLRAAGYEAYNMVGGMLGWRGPVER